MRRRWRGTATRCGSTTTTRRSTRRTWSSSGSRTRRYLRCHDHGTRTRNGSSLPRLFPIKNRLVVTGIVPFAERSARSVGSGRFRFPFLFGCPTKCEAQPCNVRVVEPADVRGDVVEMIFRGEMTCLQPVHLRRRQVCQVRLAALAGEENVILTPEDDRPRLPLAKKTLPLRIQRDVRAVVVEEVEVQPRRVRPREERDVRFPRVRAH